MCCNELPWLQVISEWKAKGDDLGSEIQASQSECRNFSSEYFRVKSANEEIAEHLDTVKRENKNLAEEIKDLLDQVITFPSVGVEVLLTF